MHFGGRLRALESEAGGRASQEARAAEGPEPNSGSRSRCTCFLAHGPLPSEKLLQREERGKEEARERERERDEKTTDLAREHDGPIQHTAGSYVSGKERVLQGTTLS
ncbi:hypothetical protein LEMLEM_LOCUS27140 [Lemmus lemmus]